MKHVILADRQDITRAGLMYVCSQFDGVAVEYAEDKVELIEQLKASPDGVVIIDYTLFDINDVNELLIFCQRFSNTRWILFSEDLSIDFVRQVISSTPQMGVLMKESPLHEIRQAIQYALQGQRFICQRMAEMMLVPQQAIHREEEARLTRTETEVLTDIASGMTTREIAEKRFSSFHTVNTHRKNIFRKLGVNNVHEATKYALRAGLVDSAEYYI